MENLKRPSLEKQAFDLITTERRLAIQANIRKDLVATVNHISRCKVMEEFALQLGLLKEPIDRLNPNP